MIINEYQITHTCQEFWMLFVHSFLKFFDILLVYSCEDDVRNVIKEGRGLL